MVATLLRKSRIFTTLHAWAVPIANWSRIVVYLVGYRRFRAPVLEQAIVVYLSKPRALEAVLERFSDQDPGSVEDCGNLRK